MMFIIGGSYVQDITRIKVLLYLNQRFVRTTWISVKEIADYLEVSERQARRYLGVYFPTMTVPVGLGYEISYEYE